jgi:biopolymer transport protein ExbD
MKKKKSSAQENINLVPMIDITSFILLALGILVMSMKKEASLDNLLKLPEVNHAMKQDTAQLQIYILRASLLPGGYINPDSTGLIAFLGKSAVPDACPNCRVAFRDEKKAYVSGSLLDIAGRPLATLEKSDNTESESVEKTSELPPSYTCAACRFEISQYLHLQDIPVRLRAEKDRVAGELLADEKKGYFKTNGIEMPAAMAKAREDSLKKGLPLMIKADNEAFYGRILQVINMAKDTLCDIKKFAVISSAEAAEKYQKSLKESNNQ